MISPIKITVSSSVYVVIIAVFLGVFQFNVQKFQQVSIQNVTQENIPQLVDTLLNISEGGSDLTIDDALEAFERQIIIELTFRAITNETLDYVSSVMYVWSFFSTLEASVGMAKKEGLDADDHVRIFKKKDTPQRSGPLYDPVLERDRMNRVQPEKKRLEQDDWNIMNKKIAMPKDFEKFAAMHGWTRLDPFASGYYIGLFVMLFPIIISGFFCWFFDDKGYIDNLIESFFFLFTIRSPDAVMIESHAWYEVLILILCSSVGTVMVVCMFWRIAHETIDGISYYGTDAYALYRQRNHALF